MPATDLSITLTALAVCAAIALLSYNRHFRRHDSVKPRMVPWSVIGLAALATGFMLVVHLVNIFGFETGGRF